MEETLKDVFTTLENIKQTASTNAKIQLVKEAIQSSDTFSKVIKYALDSRLTFNVSKFPAYTSNKNAVRIKSTIPKIFAFLDRLAAKPGATNKEKQYLFDLASIDEETYQVVQRICKKDLRCGVSVKSVNKAIPDFVFYIPYCRCSGVSKLQSIIFPALVQEKADGMFVNMIVSKKGKIKFLSRDGKKVRQLKKLKKKIKQLLPTEAYGYVYTGELLIRMNGKVLDRQTGNGILNSCIYGTAEQNKADCAFIKVWDRVLIDDFWNLKYDALYKCRYKTLCTLADLMNTNRFMLVESLEVDSIDDAYKFYKKMRGQGKEGAVVKDYSMLWKDHTSPKQVKIKNVMDVELRIVGIYKGDKDKKYKNCLGGISCESECSQIKVNVGTGFSDEQRGYFPDKNGNINKKKAKKTLKYWETQIGKIAQLECEGIIKDKNKEHHSLFLPRFIEIREDKSKADTLEGLKKR